ncbi:MAG TPA: histidine phosphatase family protein [Acidobacteriota bacterium]|nr:histidine phosphatase family protein [Acidobacteriota bacterium]
MTRLILVRHGESAWNAEGRVQGQSDPPLSKFGRRQADAIAEELADRGIREIHSSDLRRAAQTANALAERTNLRVRLDRRLREIHQGLWEGRLRTEIKRKWPELVSEWEKDPWQCSPPEGETLQQVAARARSFLGDLLERSIDGSVAVITHKVPAALLTLQVSRADPSSIWRLELNTGSWRELEATADALPG